MGVGEDEGRRKRVPSARRRDWRKWRVRRGRGGLRDREEGEERKRRVRNRGLGR